MGKALFAAALLLAGFNAHAYDGYCVVQAPQYPDLETGLNRSTLCSDVVETLTRETGFKAGYPLTLTVQSVGSNSVSLLVNYVMHEESVTLSGTEFWYPGDDYFVIDRE